MRTAPHRGRDAALSPPRAGGVGELQALPETVEAQALRPARPFLKWAGGKTQLLPRLLERMPSRIDTYYEPFVGGGALFFALASDPQRAPRRAVLGDLSAELITAYATVRDELPDLMRALAALEARYLDVAHEERQAVYYEVRAREPSHPVEATARMIFLNKTGFNGLYRVNRQGRFNVPHGRHKRPRILDCDGLKAASRVLRVVELLTADFTDVCTSAKAGDLVYFDPPFHPLSATSNFTAYTSTEFGKRDQLRLKFLIDDLTARGINAMLSDSPHPWIVGLYEGSRYDVAQYPARRAINSRADRRGAIDELLVTNYALAAAPREG